MWSGEWAEMSMRLSDWKLATIAASVFLAFVALLVFVIQPFGFENGIGWFFVLLPGASFAFHSKVAGASRVVLLILTVGVSFLWYWTISYILIKAYRLVRRAFVN
jgi:hypothetical protein